MVMHQLKSRTMVKGGKILIKTRKKIILYFEFKFVKTHLRKKLTGYTNSIAIEKIGTSKRNA